MRPNLVIAVILAIFIAVILALWYIGKKIASWEVLRAEVLDIQQGHGAVAVVGAPGRPAPRGGAPQRSQRSPTALEPLERVVVPAVVPVIVDGGVERAAAVEGEAPVVGAAVDSAPAVGVDIAGASAVAPGAVSE